MPLVLAGHDYNYEPNLAQDGVTYVVTGGGGRETGLVPTRVTRHGRGGLVTSSDVTHRGNVLTLHAIDGIGREFDSLRIECRLPFAVPRAGESGDISRARCMFRGGWHVVGLRLRRCLFSLAVLGRD